MPAELREVDAERRPRGFIITLVPEDANCLFRAWADQLNGLNSTPTDPNEIRAKCAEYMLANREEIEPNLELDVPYEAYV